MSTVYLARETLPLMQQRRWGRFIAITSVSVKQPVDGLILSNAVRAGASKPQDAEKVAHSEPDAPEGQKEDSMLATAVKK